MYTLQKYYWEESASAVQVPRTGKELLKPFDTMQFPGLNRAILSLSFQEKKAIAHRENKDREIKISAQIALTQSQFSINLLHTTSRLGPTVSS